MEILERLDLTVQTTGTVVELADGTLFRLDRQGESAEVGPDGVLTVVTYQDDRLGQRRHLRRYSPTAWVSTEVTLDPEPPPGAGGTPVPGAAPGPGLGLVGSPTIRSTY